MSFKNFNFKSPRGTNIVGYKWENNNPKFTVQLVHGMNEHAGRYDEFAQFLVKNGGVVYANDHIGFGKTAGDISNVGHMADENGMEKAADDILVLNQIIKSENPNLKTIVLGHSLGSFLTRLAFIKTSEFSDLQIYTGTGADPEFKGRIGLFIVKFLKLFGNKKRSKFLNKILFDEFNKPFKPAKTPFDSLTRDEKIVEEYMNDPLCTQIPSVQFFYDMAKLSIFVNKKENILKTDLSKPVLFVSGSMCPVGDFSKGITKLYTNYKETGVNDVELKLYKDARHEILNEINRDEVYQDILDWINLKLNKTK